MRQFATRPESRVGGPLAGAGRLQRMAISKPSDKSEQEADRISSEVMRTPGAGPSPGQSHNRGSGRLRPLATAAELPKGEQFATPPIVSEVLGTQGRPLDRAVLSFMEPRFGHDFSGIKVHTDDQAARSARAINALAYTSGSHLVFGTGQYSPQSASGRRLLAHELAHSLQQRQAQNAAGVSNQTIQRQEAPTLDLPLPEEEVRTSFRMGAEPAYGLRTKLQDLVDGKVTNYTEYKSAIAKATYAEQRFALASKPLLSDMMGTLDAISFARSVEALGRRAPTFDELRTNTVVSAAIKDAWQASDVGKKDLVTEPHEEGGWVFMNLVDGSLSIERAKAEGTDFIRLEPPPDVAYGNILVATFHTHPALGRGKVAYPSSDDLKADKRRGIPNLVAGNPGTRPAIFQVRLSGPNQRKHLASDRKIPGPSGGMAP